MIKYIKNYPFGAQVFDISVKQETQSALSCIKKICFSYLISYEGYLKAIYHQFGFKKLTPIVMSEKDIYFSTMVQRHYDNVWINYAAIKTYTFSEHDMHIKFYDDQLLDIKMTRRKFESISNRIEKIRMYRLQHCSNF